MTDRDPNLDSDLRFAASLVRQVLGRLGETTPAVRTERPRYYHGFDTDRWELEFSDEPADNVRVLLRTDDASSGSRGANFSLVAPREEAVAATADHIQDYVLELTGGEALPPCPGHRHPLHPAVVDDVACWVCPQGPEHHAEPILPPDEQVRADSGPPDP